MTIKELHYIFVIYQEKSFSKAAAQLYMSQPALSTITGRVERELGIRIFDRSTLPLTLTESGRIFIDAAKQILDVDTDLQARLKDLKGLQEGHLAIGGSSFFCSYVLSEKIGRFREIYPGIQIDLYESNIDVLKDRLLSNELDLIMETAIFPEDDLKICKYKEEEIILGVPKSFSVNQVLTDRRVTDQMLRDGGAVLPKEKAVTLSAFQELPFIFLRAGNDLYIRGMEMCRNAGFRPDIVIYLDQMLTAHNLAVRGVGCTFLRSWMIPYLPAKDALYYYKIDDPLVRRPVYFAFRKDRYLGLAIQEFLKLCGITDPLG